MTFRKQPADAQTLSSMRNLVTIFYCADSNVPRSSALVIVYSSGKVNAAARHRGKAHLNVGILSLAAANQRWRESDALVFSHPPAIARRSPLLPAYRPGCVTDSRGATDNRSQCSHQADRAARSGYECVGPAPPATGTIASSTL